VFSVKSREDNYHKLNNWVLERGISLFGVADIRPFKEDFLQLSKQSIDSFDSGISLAVRLSDAVLEEIEDRPTQL